MNRKNRLGQFLSTFEAIGFRVVIFDRKEAYMKEGKRPPHECPHCGGLEYRTPDGHLKCEDCKKERPE